MMSTRRGYGIKDTVVVHPMTGRVFTLFFFQKKRRERERRNVKRKCKGGTYLAYGTKAAKQVGTFYMS
uniref:Uncharacterized protein n=1 Tax=Oryza meridionalis TaxID=40149 RepID=A0A0E0ECR3_9ORYZ